MLNNIYKIKKRRVIHLCIPRTYAHMQTGVHAEGTTIGYKQVNARRVYNEWQWKQRI